MNLLVGIGEGIGNIIMVTPLIEALGRMNHTIDILATPNYPDSIELLQGWSRIRKSSLSLDDFDIRQYDHIIITPWFGMAQLFMGQPNIIAIPTQILQVKSEVEANMDVARSLGYQDETPPYHVEYNHRRDFSIFSDVVGFHNGANPLWPFKRWPYFHQLATKFDRVVLVGSLQDAQDNIPANVYNFQGFVSLIDTAALIRELKFFVTNDSGMMHLASALNVKTFGIFGPTSQKKNLPKGVIPISKGLECQPCQHTDRWGLCTNVECLASLEVEEVYERIKKLDALESVSGILKELNPEQIETFDEAIKRSK